MTNAFARGLRILFGIKRKQINKNIVVDKLDRNKKIKSLEEEKLFLDSDGIKEVILGEYYPTNNMKILEKKVLKNNIKNKKIIKKKNN